MKSVCFSVANWPAMWNWPEQCLLKKIEKRHKVLDLAGVSLDDFIDLPAPKEKLCVR